MVKPHTASSNRSPLDFILTRGQQIFALVSMGLYFQYFVYRTERLMDSYLNEHSFLRKIQGSVGPSPELGERYLIFKDFDTEQGQGIGNIMNGLLAAHMLGLEFNRTVCVSQDWTEFHDAFHMFKQSECSSITEPAMSRENIIKLVNFAQSPPNECQLQAKLASNEKILFMYGNTYPRWSVTPMGLWEDHYEPTERLINTLPYKKRPSTVVHLRQPDDESDHRSGLDHTTLQALAKRLPNDTFLVTNNVDLYQFFDAFGWKNPGWHTVIHSALGIEWAGNQSSDKTLSPKDSSIQLWSDWYTILQADHVFHTHSDFSLSAIHWREIDSKTIQGTNENGELQFTDESWRVDQAMPRVVDRVGDDLKNCDKETDDIIVPEEFSPLLGDDGGPLSDVKFADDIDKTDDKFPRIPQVMQRKGGDQDQNAVLPSSGRENHEQSERKLPNVFLRKEKPPNWVDDDKAAEDD